ncbi:MAG: hypothetical protein ACYC5V_15545 [Gemmatimonadaceae bacterium]
MPLCRCAALRVSDARCRVLFRDDATGAAVGIEMPTATYRLIPYLTPATPADYEALGGPCSPAPATFDDLYSAPPLNAEAPHAALPS